MKMRAPDEVVRQMERPLLVADEAARNDSAARLEAWAAQLGRATAPAATQAPDAAVAEERRREAAQLLQRVEALNAASSVFDEDSLGAIYMTVLEERARRKAGTKR